MWACLIQCEFLLFLFICELALLHLLYECMILLEDFNNYDGIMEIPIQYFRPNFLNSSWLNARPHIYFSAMLLQCCCNDADIQSTPPYHHGFWSSSNEPNIWTTRPCYKTNIKNIQRSFSSTLFQNCFLLCTNTNQIAGWYHSIVMISWQWFVVAELLLWL
jgi:hypothetical protein